MNTGEIAERMAAAAPAPRARITGVVYLLYFMTGVMGQFLVSRKLIVYGDAVNLIANALYVVLTLLLYFNIRVRSRSPVAAQDIGLRHQQHVALGNSW